MKRAVVIVLMILCVSQVDAKDRGVTLNEAVNQAKSEGRVLSARTILGNHEIKVLTKNGTVKTINKKASRSSNFAQNNLDHSSPQTWHNQFRNDSPNNRQTGNSRNVMKLDQRNSRTAKNTSQYSKRRSISRDNVRAKNRGKSSSKGKDKDN
ncbi:hypothetical protein OS175_11795 [Marinicella sp. S1101]|uniref:hypothetical protein n=1 Tax=Marinicella marina TaxID=2996016 RepID=UPI002260E53E|nr:hypothetical protein [Marinicella marina]MCX7554565.1 hypothetical protein [Marinicella marina]MDJ1141051.1 hypothetical protein [Marinicella marina]